MLNIVDQVRIGISLIRLFNLLGDHRSSESVIRLLQRLILISHILGSLSHPRINMIIQHLTESGFSDLIPTLMNQLDRLYMRLVHIMRRILAEQGLPAAEIARRLYNYAMGLGNLPI